MGDFLEKPPGTAYDIMLVLGIILIIATVVWGVTGYEERHKDRMERSYNSETRHWCEEQGGKPIYIGYSGTWNCEFEESK